MKVVCAHCGLPFSLARAPAASRAVYCCSGCALAARVPVDAEGNFPVNAAAITATTLVFVAFNQALFWLVAVLLAGRGAEDAASATNAVRFAWLSLGVGAALWATLVFFQARFGARRAGDWLVAAGAAGLIACGVVALNPACALAGNATFAAWALRGVRRKRA